MATLHLSLPSAHRKPTASGCARTWPGKGTLLKTLEPIVAEHPFWLGLNPRHLVLLTETAHAVEFAANLTIFREGEQANQFLLVLEGRVILETFVPGRGITPIQTVTTGEALGWSWLFAPYRWHFTARAVEPTRGIAFDAAALRVKAGENHDFGYALVLRVAQVLSQRLQATRLQLLDFYGVGR